MLSKDSMVKFKKAIESTYIGRFTVTEHQKVRKENGTTGFCDVDVIINQPCRLSFSSSRAVSDGMQAGMGQSVKLFVKPEISILPGSKITVTQNGVTTAYKQSGVPAVYETHHEIMLELFEGWA